jgi:putative membrane protein
MNTQFTATTKTIAIAMGLSLALVVAAQNTKAPSTAAPAAHGQPMVGTQDGAAKGKLTDADFVAMATQSGLTEIEVSQLAVEKSQSPKLRKFAQRIVKDHTAANTQLKQLATESRIPVPAQLDPAHQQEVDKFKQLSGRDFDSAYIAQMKKDHDTVVGLFDNAAGQSDLNVQLRVFANKNLPALRKHQDFAHKLSDTPPKTAQN